MWNGELSYDKPTSTPDEDTNTYNRPHFGIDITIPCTALGLLFGVGIAISYPGHYTPTSIFIGGIIDVIQVAYESR